MKRKSIILWIGAGLAAVLAIGLFVGGRALWNRFDAMERKMEQMSNRAYHAAESAKAAAATAIAAEQKAEQAAEGKIQAEKARTWAVQERAEAETRARTAQEEAALAKAEAEKIRKERDEELDRMQQSLNRLVETRRTAMGLVMNLPESALRFDFNSAALRQDSRELLSRIAGVLMASGNFGLTVHGHTDDVGSAAYNRELSLRRAKAVKQYLADAGIPPEIISVEGHGKSSPLVEGTTETQRARNRRVEIALTDTVIRYSGSDLRSAQN